MRLASSNNADIFLISLCSRNIKASLRLVIFFIANIYFVVYFKQKLCNVFQTFTFVIKVSEKNIFYIPFLVNLNSWWCDVMKKRVKYLSFINSTKSNHFWFCKFHTVNKKVTVLTEINLFIQHTESKRNTKGISIKIYSLHIWCVANLIQEKIKKI